MQHEATRSTCACQRAKVNIEHIIYHGSALTYKGEPYA